MIIISNAILKASSGNPNKLFSFLNPLAAEIWIYMLVAYVLVSITIWIVARFSPREWKEPKLCDDCLFEKYERLYWHEEHECFRFFEIENNTYEENMHECDEFTKDDEIESNPEWFKNDFTLANSFWFAIGTLMQQGSDLNPKVQYLLK